MRRLSFEVTLNEHGERLDKMLARRLNAALDGGFSRNKTKKLVDAGKVRRNGEVERFGSTSLEYDDIIEVDVDPEVVGSPKSHKPVDLGPEDILWEDGFVIAIDKPAGLPSQATRDPRRDHALAAVERYLARRGESDPYVAVHHRLDVGTSGVLVLACDRRANAGLTEAFRDRRVDKTYRAVVMATDADNDKVPGRRWTVENHLDERRRGNTTRQVSVDAGGDWAKTTFEVVRQTGRLQDVCARPETGRRHQIRAHLAGEGRPIVGDERYGGAMEIDDRRVERMMLHARKLVLPHPVHDQKIEIVSPLPEVFERLWRDDA